MRLDNGLEGIDKGDAVDDPRTTAKINRAFNSIITAISLGDGLMGELLGGHLSLWLDRSGDEGGGSPNQLPTSSSSSSSSGVCQTINGGPAMFAVRVRKDGGINGTATTLATFTYSVWTLCGAVLGTAMTPQHPRPMGALKYINEEGYSSSSSQVGDGYGVGFFNIDGSFKLWSAGEVLADPDYCVVSSSSA